MTELMEANLQDALTKINFFDGGGTHMAQKYFLPHFPLAREGGGGYMAIYLAYIFRIFLVLFVYAHNFLY